MASKRGLIFKRTLSCSNLAKVEELRKIVENNVFTSTDETKPMCLFRYSEYTISCPTMSNFPRDFQENFERALIDVDMEKGLEDGGSLNWCRTAKRLRPLATKEDGNCLTHAVSIGMWGYHDSSLFLRRLIYVAMQNDATGNLFRDRWQNEAMSMENSYSSVTGLDLDGEWMKVIERANDKPNDDPRALEMPYKALEEIHVFVLANILRRPIIIISDVMLHSFTGSDLAPCSLGGVYLPLLWHAEDCFKTPLTLAYDMNSFSPLIGEEDNPRDEYLATEAERAIPLIRQNGEWLKIHMLLPQEKARFQNILEKYMYVTTLFHTTKDNVKEVISAKLEYKVLPDKLNLMKDYFQDCERIFNESTDEDIYMEEEPKRIDSLELNEVLSQDSDKEDIYEESKMCTTKNCEFYGSTATKGKCTKCYLESTKLPATPVKNDETLRMRITTTASKHNPDPLAGPMPASKLTPYEPNIRLNNPDRPQDLPMYSMLPTECATHGCHYNASVHTKPYCHECHDRKQKPAKHGTLDLGNQIPSSPRKSIVRQDMEPHSNDMKSFAVGQPSQVCMVAHCKNPCDADLEGLCSSHRQHFVKPSKTQAPVALTTIAATLVTTSFSNRCKHPGCFNVPTTQSGFCEVCDHQGNRNMSRYAAAKPTDSVKNIVFEDVIPPTLGPCRKSGCTFTGSERYRGYCSVCYKKHRSKRHSNGSASSSGCSTPDCEGVRIERSPMCYYCTKHTNQGLPVIPNRGKDAGTQTTPPKDLGRNIQPSGYDAKAFDKEGLTDELSRTVVRHHYKDYPKKVCVSPLCENEVMVGAGENKLCRECFQILCDDAAKKAERKSSAEFTEQSRTAGNQSNAPKCKGPSCDMFGSVETMGYCSKCFNEMIAARDRVKTSPVRQPSQLNRRGGDDQIFVPMDSDTRIATEGASQSPLKHSVTYYNPARVNLFNTDDYDSKICPVDDCDRYGDVCFNGLCSLHYDPSRPVVQIGRDNVLHIKPKSPRLNRPPGTRFTSATNGDNDAYVLYPDVRGKQERLPTQRTRKPDEPAIQRQIENQVQKIKCRERLCENYASKENNGFCNSCKKRLDKGY
ncbi:unnamed protein product [Owenia fusiformis]|uniref:ubiquitinyl hydrolase 1 n=1 Tax=Owenia fusiformis TaxID=6347 RepID=A0A8J1TBE6_OWEFU|nr:unnamed protein product [Owenia fusiformis]